MFWLKQNAMSGIDNISLRFVFSSFCRSVRLCLTIECIRQRRDDNSSWNATNEIKFIASIYCRSTFSQTQTLMRSTNTKSILWEMTKWNKASENFRVRRRQQKISRAKVVSFRLSHRQKRVVTFRRDVPDSVTTFSAYIQDAMHSIVALCFCRKILFNEIRDRQENCMHNNKRTMQTTNATAKKKTTTIRKWKQV